MSVHDFLHFSNLRLGQHRLGLTGHNVGHRMVEELRLPTLHGATDVAIGDESHHLAVVVERDSQSQFALAHVDDGLAQVHVLRNDGQFVCTHHILCRGEQFTPQLPTWMELGEVAWLEVANLHQSHRQGVAHGQGGRGGTGGSEIERTRLVAHPHLDMAGGIFGQQRVGVARHGNDGDMHVKHHGDEAQQLVGLARIAEGQHHVVGCHHAQVAMVDIQRVDEKGRGAGR